MKNRLASLILLASAVSAALVLTGASVPAGKSGSNSNAAPKTLSVSKFGAKPDDGKDDTKALRKAAKYCREHPGTTLIIPPGTYGLTDPEAKQLEEDVLAGKYGSDPEKKMFTPYFPYVSGLDFSGSRGVTVEAAGATLLLDGWMEPVSIVDCEGFTLRGLTIDYNVQPHSEGVIVDVEDGWFTVEFDSDRQMTRKMPQSRICVWDDRYGVVHKKVYSFSKRELLEGNRLRIKGKMDPELKGMTIGMTHTFHFRPAVFVGGSTNTTIDSVTIHSQPGMGVLGWDSRDITLHAVNVVPRKGKRFSTNTDATHFAACRGLIRIEDCVFCGQGDDGINVHGYYHSIIGREPGGWLRTTLKAPTFTHSQRTDVPRIGDTIEITGNRTLRPESRTVVEDVAWEQDSTEVRLRLRDPLPENYGDYYLFNASKIPDLEFRRNRVLGNFARGVLSKARHAVVEDNYFQGCTGIAIHVGAEGDWQEGSFAEEALIRANMIVNCGQSQGMQGNASGIAVVMGARDLRNSYVHGHIVIKDNEIVSELFNAECGIAVENARQLEISGNRVSGCKAAVRTKYVKKISIE